MGGLPSSHFDTLYQTELSVTPIVSGQQWLDHQVPLFKDTVVKSTTSIDKDLSALKATKESSADLGNQNESKKEKENAMVEVRSSNRILNYETYETTFGEIAFPDETSSTAGSLYEPTASRTATKNSSYGM